MSLTLLWIIFAIGAILIVVSFIMSPTSNSFSGALVGSSDLELFKESKERGFKKWTKRIMFFLGFLIMLLSLIIRAI